MLLKVFELILIIRSADYTAINFLKQYRNAFLGKLIRLIKTTVTSTVLIMTQVLV